MVAANWRGCDVGATVPLAFPPSLRYCCPTTIFSITHTDIISAQHFWTGGLETAGPGCYDAVAIARAAGFRMLVTSRIRHAAIVP